MKENIKNNIIVAVAILLIGIVAYSIKMAFYTISIDTEVLINNPDELLNSWISIGRYGLVYIKKFLGLIPINIKLTNILAFIIFYFSIIIWIINLNKLEGKNNKIANFAFGSIVITSPLLAEQFGFSLQSIEIALGFLFLSIAIFLIEKVLEEEKLNLYIIKIIELVISTLLLSIVFCCYQAFIVLYVTICSYFVLVKSRNKIEYKLIFKYIAIFAVSLAIYYITDIIIKDKMAVASSVYLKEQIYWRKEGIANTIYRTIASIGMFVLGYGITNNCTYSFLFIIVVIYLLKRYKIKENKIFYLCVIFFLTTPFITTILKGTAELDRARFSHVFLIAFLINHLLNNAEGKIKRATIYIMVYTILIQTISTTLLFYNDYKRYQEDVNFSRQINSIIEKMDVSKPVIFLGKYKTQTVSIKGEVLGRSFFEWDYNTIYGVNIRANRFLKTLGIYYISPTLEQIEEARTKYKELAIWPNSNSIIEMDKYIIINFGEN